MLRGVWGTSPVPRADLSHLKSGRWRSMLLVGGAALALMGAGGLSDFARAHALLVNASPSLRCWAIWLTRGAEPGKGDLVLFVPPRSALLERHFGREPGLFGKRVLGMPGQHVTREGRQFFVDGVPVALAKPMTRTGEPLALGPTGTIPKGCYFVGSPHKDGFDSRYAAIGWICRPRILGTGRAIL
jgi:conjugal transfer pilin signal peptidase TrbI